MPAASTGFSTIYAFGDSLSDAGNVYTGTLHLLPFSPPYSDGRFSNGPVWVQDLASSLGLAQPGPSLTGGTDFAYGGAETGTTPSHSAGALDLPSQLAQFQAQVPAPAQGALYTLSVGANDVMDAVSTAATDQAKANATIVASVLNIGSFITDLARDGARDVVMLTVPDLGKTPSYNGNPVNGFVASFLSAAFDITLVNTLRPLAASEGVNLSFVDTYALLDGAIANPAAYGLTNVTQPVWTGNYYDPFSGSLRATGSAQNQYLFFDKLHPTETGHAAVAASALGALNHTS